MACQQIERADRRRDQVGGNIDGLRNVNPGGIIRISPSRIQGRQTVLDAIPGQRADRKQHGFDAEHHESEAACGPSERDLWKLPRTTSDPGEKPENQPRPHGRHRRVLNGEQRVIRDRKQGTVIFGEMTRLHTDQVEIVETGPAHHHGGEDQGEARQVLAFGIWNRQAHDSANSLGQPNLVPEARAQPALRAVGLHFFATKLAKASASASDQMKPQSRHPNAFFCIPTPPLNEKDQNFMLSGLKVCATSCRRETAFPDTMLAPVQRMQTSPRFEEGFMETSGGVSLPRV